MEKHSTEKIIKEIPADLIGKRIDQVLPRLFEDYSRSCLQKWLENGHIKVNQATWSRKTKVMGGEQVELSPPQENRNERWQAESIPLDIVYEDDSILVVNKPAGLVAHPAAGHHGGTLVNALLNHAPVLESLPRAGLVHRLDRATTGLLVVAKTLQAHKSLVDQLQERSMGRRYEAVVCGVMTGGGKVDEPMGRHPVDRKRMAVVSTGKTAVTHYRLLQRFAGHTHIEVKLETGRTHQIRVHMSHIRYPLVGDPVYGRRLFIPKGCSDDLRQILSGFKRQALHAKSLTLVHPKKNEEMSWSVALPEDMQNLLNILGA